MNLTSIKNFDYRDFAVVAVVKIILALATVVLGAIFIVVYLLVFVLIGLPIRAFNLIFKGRP